MIKFFKNLFYKEKVSVKEYEQFLKRHNKKALIRELVCLSQKINHNQCGVSKEFQKSLREFSKKQLIKAIVLLKIPAENKKIRKAVGL